MVTQTHRLKSQYNVKYHHGQMMFPPGGPMRVRFGKDKVRHVTGSGTPDDPKVGKFRPRRLTLILTYVLFQITWFYRVFDDLPPPAVKSHERLVRNEARRLGCTHAWIMYVNAVSICYTRVLYFNCHEASLITG